MSVKVYSNKVIIKVEYVVEKSDDSIVVNVGCGRSRRYVTVCDMKGWVCFNFGVSI